MAVQLMTIAEYARHRGCDEKAVRKALAEGRITRAGTGRRCIDPEVADIQWAKNTRARVGSVRKDGPDAQPTSQGAADGPEAPDGGGDPGYQNHRARREKAEADMAELEARRKAGQLVALEPTERAVFDAFRALRDATFAACRNAAPMVLGLADVREIQHQLEDHQRAAFAEWEERMQRRLQELAQS